MFMQFRDFFNNKNLKNSKAINYQRRFEIYLSAAGRTLALPELV